jgi:hypothetical protein
MSALCSRLLHLLLILALLGQLAGPSAHARMAAEPVPPLTAASHDECPSHAATQTAAPAETEPGAHECEDECRCCPCARVLQPLMFMSRLAVHASITGEAPARPDSAALPELQGPPLLRPPIV